MNREEEVKKKTSRKISATDFIKITSLKSLTFSILCINKHELYSCSLVFVFLSIYPVNNIIRCTFEKTDAL